jgi:heme/copper-type cytochrome/quinol oxidase subunit 3
MTSKPASVETHGHEEIHLPSPSWGPIVLAFGVVVLAFGFVLPLLFPVGAIVLLVGIWKVSSFAELPELRPSMGVSGRLLGMWVFLASEIMFFSGLIATFLGYKQRAGDVAHLLNVPLMTIATFILLSSSFAAVSALSALQQDKVKVFRNWLATTMVLGGLFILIELLEWGELIGHGITTGTLFGSAFFTLTGFHGMHVLIGLIWMTFLMVRTVRGMMSSHNVLGIEIFGLYWHFVDIVWIILFTIIYLL